MLGFEVSERTVSRLMPRSASKPAAAQRWISFLRNHRDAIAAMDFFAMTERSTTPAGPAPIQPPEVAREPAAEC
jgi:hypothetical protein